MNCKITCIITDDEPFARKGLQGYVEKVDFLELKAVCEDAIELSNFLQKGTVDLLFLDIEMPHLTGVQFLKAIPNPPKVIFTTAYEQYAIEAFNLEVLDYLLKPISYERFLKAVWKSRDYFNFRSGAETTPAYMFIKVNGKLEKINFAEVLFIEGMENYLSIQTTTKRMVTHMTLKVMLERLQGEDFIQTHKSYIVRKDKIDSIEGNMLHLGEYIVPVSKYLREEVLKQIVG